MPKRKNQRYRVERRREEATIRQTERDSLTDQQQLEKLNKLFGVDKGAKKERTRLLRRMDAASSPKEVKGRKIKRGKKD